MINQEQIKKRFETMTMPVIKVLEKFGITPDVLTISGCLALIIASVFIGKGQTGAALLFLFAGSLLDGLDGQLARHTGRTSLWGAFLDSTLDRISEIAIALGLLFWFHKLDMFTPFLSASILGAITLSLMVSYTRARAEGLGIECREGILQRPHRGVLIFLGILLGAHFMYFIILVILILSFITVIQRINHVYRNKGETSQTPVNS